MGSSLVSGVRSLETISYTPIAHRSPLPIGNLAVESRWNENYHFFFLSFLVEHMTRAQERKTAINYSTSKFPYPPNLPKRTEDIPSPTR